MLNLENFKREIAAIYAQNKEILGQARRAIVIENMRENERQGYDCQSCIGYCCTYEYNSMMVTPVETFEILVQLVDEDRLDASLIQKLEKNASDYRLDKELWQKDTLLRRYYTCPFYMDQKLGCSLSVKLKPLGCLAFNSLEKVVSKAGVCETDIQSLRLQVEKNEKDEGELAELIKGRFAISWNKKPLTTAILDFLSIKKAEV